MKASYRRNTRFHIAVRIVIVVAGAVAMLIFFGKLLGSVGSFVSYPFYAVRNWINDSSAVLPSYIRTRGELVDEIEALKSDIASRSGMDLTIARLSEENESLQHLLGVTPGETLAASVIARPPYLPYDSVLIDRGEMHGVLEGAVVYYAKDAVIGYVSRVFPKSSLVTLFSNPGTRASVFVTGPNIFATAVGEGGGVIRIGIPQGISVLPGSAVLMPVLGGGVLGEIRHVNSLPTEPEQYAFVVADIPLQSLRLVAIRKDATPTVSYEEASAIIKGMVDTPFVIEDIPLGGTASGTIEHASSTDAETASTVPMLP